MEVRGAAKLWQTFQAAWRITQFNRTTNFWVAAATASSQVPEGSKVFSGQLGCKHVAKIPAKQVRESFCPTVRSS